MHPRLAIARSTDGLAEMQTFGRPLNRFGRRACMLLAVLLWRMRARSTSFLISPSAPPRSVAHRFSMRRLTRLPIIFLKTHTKIIERHPPKLDRGTLARASSAAALALTPKPGRLKKKTWQNKGHFLYPKKMPKTGTHFWPVRGATVEPPTENQKTHQKPMAKNNAKFPRQKLSPKLPRKNLQKTPPNATKNCAAAPKCPDGNLAAAALEGDM